MASKEYIKRICDSELQLKLDAFGAVHIVGPKWCGKTTTAKQFAKSYIELQDPDKRDRYLETAKIKPDLLTNGRSRLIYGMRSEFPSIEEMKTVYIFSQVPIRSINRR